MPRLQPIEKEHAPADAREFFELDEERYGRVLNNTKIYAYNTPVLEAMKAVVSGYTKTNALPLALKSLVRVHIALVDGCPFCADLHASIGIGDGLAPRKLTSLHGDQSEEFDERERVALEYADAITLSDRDVTDELFERVRAEFTAPQIVELTFAIAVENLFSKFHNALGIAPQGFCPIEIRTALLGTDNDPDSA